MGESRGTENQGPPRVLLVDSNRVFLRTLERTLHPDKYEIRTALSVLEALAEISRTPFDLVISEIKFTGLSGFDLVRRLNEDPRRDSMSVILITGNPGGTDADKGRQLGVADMLLKPVRPQLVRQRVRRVLENLGCFDSFAAAPHPQASARGESAPKGKLAVRPPAEPKFSQRRSASDGGSIARILNSSVRLKKKQPVKASPLADPRMRKVRVPVFRAATQQVLGLLSNPDATVKQVSRIVETDPGLAASVLKVVNSAYYGLKTSVGTVPDACALLGLRDLGSICLGASVSEALLVHDDSISRACWAHSLATGYAAREIGNLVGQPRNADPGVAGILSGIGILATVASPDIDHFSIAEIVNRRNCRWAVAEREVLGFDHAELGGAIARQWGMPPWIGRVIEDCEDPAKVGRPDEWVVAVGSFAVQWKRPTTFPRHPDPVSALEELAGIRPNLWARIAPKLEGIATAAWEQPDPAGVTTETA